MAISMLKTAELEHKLSFEIVLDRKKTVARVRAQIRPPSLAEMDRCPIEMWDIIFAFACTDGGNTGRSLSLTSRHIRELSKPFKLQSLIVTEAQQILSLARLLTDTPPKYRRVRYLFIGNAGNKWFDEAEASEGIVRSYVQWSERDEEIRRRQEPILDAYLHIIKATAPTLLALVVHFLRYSISKSLPDGVSFPSLVELSLYGLPIQPSAPSSWDHPPSFPSLRYLYLAHHRFDPAAFVRHITRVAPLLTRLSLPYQYPMERSLLQLLGSPPPHGQSRDDDSSSSSSIAVRPLTLKVLLIDRYYNRTLSAPLATRMLYKSDAEKVAAIAEKDDRVYLVKKEQSTRIRDVEMYWLDRMEGGDGEWVLPPAL